MEIILASGSPRRRELLERVGLIFKVEESGFEETFWERGDPSELVLQNALGKERDIRKRFLRSLVIGADTVVAQGRKIFGKPRDERQAIETLKELAGKKHEVYTAYAIGLGEEERCGCVKTSVSFRNISNEEIRDYVRSGEPFDKAGAYAIQGKAGVFVRAIKGCYSNIVGISVFKLAEMLKEFGIEVL